LAEREILLKEIHHRVKNNLQIVSSLLSLQSRFIDDKKAQEAVNEGQNRVKSMALIHQKLYQRGNLMGVEVLDYIQSLTTNLKSTYGIDDQKVAVIYDIEPLNVDVDTLIPIGLILNELVSNTFKHAFPMDDSGELRIKLKQDNKQLELTVMDNGIGTLKDLSKTDSFGLRMIRSLALKLEAEVNYEANNGFMASLLITNYKLV
jgi:two-component sensor histidine kinase